MQNINFQHLTLPTTPNYYLVCPKDYCNNKPNDISPIFPYNREQLIKNFQTMINQQPRITRAASDQTNYKYSYIQRSKIFRFPDFITVKFIALNDTQSTLAIFSCSKYGSSDFGVNKKRVQSWLQQLQEIT